jgi:hypothetical protein
MAQACAHCSRANPDEAVYCFFDGNLLHGHRAAARMPTGSQPFASEFVFPDGQACRNFDQLALACQQRWAVSCDLLQQGILERFLGGQGRADLAGAARAAAAFPDPERGLDQLLGRLPTQVLAAPKLQVSPGDINLGQIRAGVDQTVTLHLENAGGRLLYGAVVSDSNWLTLGDSPGGPQKLFQCGGDTTVPLHVRGQHLRAGIKPFEGRLTFESNGGQLTVRVRAEVPVLPFREGVLAGATSPRQVAEKAKAAPKEAAALFEQGLVARWFQDNGWTYPVPGPAASGLSAVQQFFEALGLAKAPKVDISGSRIDWRGKGGDVLRFELEVRTQEKRPVFAFASANQPWLAVECHASGKAFARVIVSARVPGQFRGTLHGQVQVTANGNQRFLIPVTLEVLGDGRPSYAAHEPTVADALPVTLVEPGELPVVAITVPPPARPPSRYDEPTPRPRRRPPAPVRKTAWGLHIIPAVMLMLVVLGVVVRDALTRPPRRPEPGPRTDVKIEEHNGEGGGQVAEVPIDPTPRVRYQYGKNMRFGLVGTEAVGGRFKQLTYSVDGHSNSTVLRVDGQVVEFGGLSGETRQTPAAPGFQPGQSFQSKAVWAWNNKIQVSQALDVVPSQQPVDVGGTPKRLLDTCLVGYQILNLDNRPHRVGLRALVDTLIGINDGVPFTVPGRQGLVNTSADFRPAARVPDFIQALEVPNLRAPGTVAHMSLKLGGGFEAPERVSLTRWPSFDFIRWEVPVQNMRDDSAVVLYWQDKALQPGEKRTLGFAYGLGTVSGSEGGGKLAVSLSGSFEPGEEFTVTAYVNRPQPDQTLTLNLPNELQRTQGDATQAVRAQVGQENSVVTWKVRVVQTGRYTLEVRSSTGVSQSRTLTITRTDPQKKKTSPDNIFR